MNARMYDKRIVIIVLTTLSSYMAADRVSLILHWPIYFYFDQMEEVKEAELQTRRPIRLNLTVFHVCASSISLEAHK